MHGHGHRFNPEKADKLLDPKRKETINPDAILELLKINQGDVIADMGSGNGFFTIPMAQKTNGTVYAIDIEKKMLKLLKERAESYNLKNIEYIESGLEHIPLSDQSINKVLIAFVIHEVPDRKRVFEELKRMRTHDSVIVIVEWQAVEMNMGPPLSERIPANILLREIEDSGLTGKMHEINDKVYAIKID